MVDLAETEGLREELEKRWQDENQDVVGLPHLHHPGLRGLEGKFSSGGTVKRNARGNVKRVEGDFQSLVYLSWKGEPGESQPQQVICGAITDDDTWPKEKIGLYIINHQKGNIPFGGKKIAGSVERIPGYFLWTGKNLAYVQCFNPEDSRIYYYNTDARKFEEPSKIQEPQPELQPPEKADETKRPEMVSVYDPKTRSFKFVPKKN